MVIQTCCFLVLFVAEVLSIAPPAYVSDWIPITANGPDNEVEIVRSHTLNELPMKVDVQVRVQHNGTYYYFNAMNSAQSGDYNSEYGGVIYMFDASNVKIVAPGPSNCGGCKGYVVYLGDNTIYGPPGFPLKFKSGMVRFRVWEMCTFGKPALIKSVPIDNAFDSYGSLEHGLMSLDLLVVHVHLPNGYITHAEGAISVQSTSQPFGGVMIAYDHTNIKYWSPKRGPGPDSTNGVPFFVGSGWGISGDVYSSSAVTATMFGFDFSTMQSPKKFSQTITKGAGTTDYVEFETTSNIDATNILPILTMTPASPSGDAFGLNFHVSGSASYNESGFMHGLVFGMSQRMVYLWRPDGCILVLGGLWGDGTTTDCSTRVEVTLDVLETNYNETICELGCSATAIGPMCACGSTGMTGQFCGSPVTCPRPNDTDPATVQISQPDLSLAFNTTLVFTCIDGYVVVSGDIERTCSWTGNWTGEPLICDRISCGTPDVLPDSRSLIQSTTSEKFEGKVQYACEPGYEIESGNGERVCQMDGTWSGYAPYCNVSCGNAYNVYNGAEHTDGSCRTVGCFSNFTCKVGYENFTGSDSRFCQMNAEWTGTAPGCTIKYCESPQNGTNSQLSFSTTHFGSEAVYTCDLGYVSTADQATLTLTVSCQDDKTWNQPPLDCEPLICLYPEPGRLALPVEVKTYRYKDVVEHQCMLGYILGNGSLIRECQANATWSGEKPNCKDIECPALGNITKGQIIVTGITYGSQAVAICQEGAAIREGDMVRTCSLSGMWEGPKNITPVCEDVKQIFPSQFNLSSAGNYTYDSNHLAVDPKTLSKFRRTKKSIFYNKPSHIAIGTIGILIIIAIVFYICSLDTIKLTQQIKKYLLKKGPNPADADKKKVYKVYVVRK